MSEYIYLDEASTTKPKQEVIDAMIPYLTEKWFNPSSLYNGSVDVKKDIENARKTIAEFINAEPEEIYFTSGASESNNWAIQGFVNERRRKLEKPSVITSRIEHKSIKDCVEGIRSSDLLAAFINVDNNGFISMSDLEDTLKRFIFMNESSPLVTIGMANNEIGTIQDTKEISNIVHRHNGVFHTDATQALGKIPINVKEMGIDMMSVSGHKIGAVKGIGFLYIKNGTNIQPLIYGSQERNLRGGTENVAGIIGLGKAVELCDLSDEKMREMYKKRNYFLDLLESKFDCKLNGDRENRLPNNISLTFLDNISGESILYSLSVSDIFVSTSSACNSHSIEPSYVLKSIGLSDDEAISTIRITISNDITYEDIDCFVLELEKIIKIIKL